MSFLICHVGYGQNDSAITNTLTLSPGLDYISLKDRTFSPIVFTGVAPKVKLGFSQNRRGHALWHSIITVSLGNINHENEYFSSTYASVHFCFNYLSIIKSSRKSKIYLGGQFRSALDVLDYDGFESGAWFSAQQLEPIILYTFSISEKQSFTGQFSYPVVSLVSRPRYAGVDEFVVINSDNISKILYSRKQIQSLNKVINPNFKFKYAYNLPKICFSISANYSYLQVNSIRKYYKHEFGINLGFHLKISKKNEK